MQPSTVSLGGVAMSQPLWTLGEIATITGAELVGGGNLLPPPPCGEGRGGGRAELDADHPTPTLTLSTGGREKISPILSASGVSR